MIQSPFTPKERCFTQHSPHILVVDDFYKDPDRVRQYALEQEYVERSDLYKGVRTKDQFLFPFVKERFEDLLGVTITDWTSPAMNGVFQKTTENEPLVYHADHQDYAAAIYLTPNAPPDTGTSFWKHKVTGSRYPGGHSLNPLPAGANAQIFTDESVLDASQWRLCDKIANIYNRCAIWHGPLIHSGSSYEGYDLDFPRLVQLFFFNVSSLM